MKDEKQSFFAEKGSSARNFHGTGEFGFDFPASRYIIAVHHIRRGRPDEKETERTVMGKSEEKRTAVRWIKWTPTAACVAFAVATEIALAVRGGAEATKYLGAAATVAFSVMLILIDARFSLNLSLFSIVLFHVHVVLAMDFGTALGFYDRLPWWDLLVHGLFGFLCCALVSSLYVRIRGEFPSGFAIAAVVLMTLGVAAIWEMYEFLADLAFKTDMQKLAQSVAAGHSPVFDTMTDLLIAVLGAAVYVPAAIVEKRRGGGLFVKKPSSDLGAKGEI